MIFRKIVKILFFIIFFTTLCFGANAQEMQEIFDDKKPLYEKLTNDFANYPNMDEAKKQEYEKDMQKLLDVEFLIKQFRIDANTTKETFEIFAPYINSYSYFIARYLPYKKYIDASILLMSGVMKYTPDDAYMETFVFLLANDGKFNEALDFYPKFLEKYDDNDVKIDFDMVKDMALESAIKENNIELLQKLNTLNYISNPNKKYFIKERKTNWTPLFIAISAKNIEALEILIKNGADIFYTDENGVDAFYLAVYSGQINMADKLILAGYKPNLEPKSIKHPLAIAVLNSDIKMLEYLQTLGYDIRKEIFGKKNLLEFAITNPNKDIGREKQPLYINLEMYKYLIDKFKKELNNPNKDGDTTLHQFVTHYIRVQNQQNDIEEKLPTDVKSILMLAGISQKDMKQEYLKQLKPVIKYLIDNGANKKIKNKQNKRAYEIAIDGKIEDKELLEWLKR